MSVLRTESVMESLSPDANATLGQVHTNGYLMKESEITVSVFANDKDMAKRREKAHPRFGCCKNTKH